jgi:predicted dehydrogenase
MQDKRFLQVIYSRQLSSAIEFSNDFPAPYVFDDLIKLAEYDNIDAVYIASPNNCHAKQAILMMRNGKHVLCEKPAAVNSAELNQMVATAKENNVCFMEAMLSTFLPNYLQVKKSSVKIAKVYGKFLSILVTLSTLSTLSKGRKS